MYSEMLKLPICLSDTVHQDADQSLCYVNLQTASTSALKHTCCVETIRERTINILNSSRSTKFLSLQM